MNKKYIEQWTREAGGFDATPEFLAKFAALVAAAEREACAKIVLNEAYQYTSPVWAFEIVNDIRARGQA